MFQHSIPFEEPVRWKQLLAWLNHLVSHNELLSVIVPLGADLFVFTYPIFLVVMYVCAIVYNNKEEKFGALYIFTSSVVIAVVNIIIQYFIDKQRPEIYITTKDALILDHLPTAPFPSDHAGVSAAIAVATLIWYKKTRNKIYLWCGIFFAGASLIMSVARVAVAVHWPTDVIVWIFLWSVCAWVLYAYKPIWSFLTSRIFSPLIALEERIVRKMFKR